MTSFIMYMYHPICEVTLRTTSSGNQRESNTQQGGKCSWLGARITAIHPIPVLWSKTARYCKDNTETAKPSTYYSPHICENSPTYIRQCRGLPAYCCLELPRRAVAPRTARRGIQQNRPRQRRGTKDSWVQGAPAERKI